jgi:hypothetical protein
MRASARKTVIDGLRGAAIAAALAVSATSAAQATLSWERSFLPDGAMQETVYRPDCAGDRQMERPYDCDPPIETSGRDR